MGFVSVFLFLEVGLFTHPPFAPHISFLYPFKCYQKKGNAMNIGAFLIRQHVVDLKKRWAVSAGENYSLSRRVSGYFLPNSADWRHSIRADSEVCEADPEEGAVLVC